MSTDFKGLNVNKKIRSLSLSQIINCTEENDSPEFSSTDVTINYVSNNQEITNERWARLKQTFSKKILNVMCTKVCHTFASHHHIKNNVPHIYTRYSVK